MTTPGNFSPTCGSPRTGRIGGSSPRMPAGPDAGTTMWRLSGTNCTWRRAWDSRARGSMTSGRPRTAGYGNNSRRRRNSQNGRAAAWFLGRTIYGSSPASMRKRTKARPGGREHARIPGQDLDPGRYGYELELEQRRVVFGDRNGGRCSLSRTDRFCPPCLEPGAERTISSFSLAANSRPNPFSFPRILSCLSRPWRTVLSEPQARIFRDCEWREIELQAI